MKKNYIGNIAGFVTGIVFVTGFYFFDFYLFTQDNNIGSCIIAGFLFFLLGFGRFYKVNSLENREQEMLLFIAGLLITELYFSVIKRLSNEALYTITISYIAGMLLTRIPRFNSPIKEEE